jgi:phage-related protein
VTGWEVTAEGRGQATRSRQPSLFGAVRHLPGASYHRKLLRDGWPPPIRTYHAQPNLDSIYQVWYDPLMPSPAIKPLRWVGSAHDDLREFPPPVRQVMGTALYLAQTGGKHPAAKPLAHILKGAGVLEVVENHDTDTFRTVYTVRFPGAIYVLHAFQKKSKRGIKTPQHEIDLIRHRYEQARADYERRLQGRRRRGP